jgi:hypothetical protein
MQSTILPEIVQLTDYIYTLLGLTVATLILVINLPHIMKLWQAFRKVQSFFWRRAAHFSKISIRRLFEIRMPQGRIHQPDLEMQSSIL